MMTLLPLEPGAVLGDYRLTGRLGRGGMGEVFRAVHLRLHRPVALKVIAPGLLADPRAVSRFLREIEAVGRLDHPNLVRATDARQEGPYHFLVMDLVEGLDLARVVGRLGPLSIADACAAIRQAAEGLAYAHARGIVHRDIKPSNLMLAAGGTVKLLDLGLARLRAEGEAGGDTLTGTCQMMGTPDYIAPEQCLGSHAATERSDLYSLGCTLYHLLVSRPPYAGYRSPFEKMQAHGREPLPPIAEARLEVPAALAELVGRMTAKEPGDRPGSAGAVVEALRPFCTGSDLAGLLARANETKPAETVGDVAPVPSTQELAGTTVPTTVGGGPMAAATLGGGPTSPPTPSVRRAESPSGSPRAGREWLGSGRRRSVAVALALGGLLALGFLGLHFGRRQAVPPSASDSGPIQQDRAHAERSVPKPLRVESLEVHLLRPGDGVLEDHGLIGRDSAYALSDDRIRVAVELSEPGYAYLLALNTNGTVQALLPESDEEAPRRARRLEAYEDPTVYYGLTDGPGEQTIVVVASATPLPSFRDWRESGPAILWGHLAPDAATLVRFDGQRFQAPSFVRQEGLGVVVAERGRKVSQVPPLVEQACRTLRARPGVDAVAALAFPVKPALMPAGSR